MYSLFICLIVYTFFTGKNAKNENFLIKFFKKIDS